jgi:alpha-tubulin suppressor-like RCC1 family protein
MYPGLILRPTTLSRNAVEQLMTAEWLAETGELRAFGRNVEGQLGLGRPDNKEHYTLELPQLPEGERIDTIACGEYHSVAISKSKNLLSWGR